MEKTFKNEFPVLFPSLEKGGSLHIMKRLLCGAEQYQTSIHNNSHFLFLLDSGIESSSWFASSCDAVGAGRWSRSLCSRRRAPARARAPLPLRGSVIAPTPARRPGPARPQRSGPIKLSRPEKAPSLRHSPPSKLDVTGYRFLPGTAPRSLQASGEGVRPHQQSQVACAAGSRGLGAAPLPAEPLRRGDRASALLSRPRGAASLLVYFVFRFALLRASNSLSPLPNNSAAAGLDLCLRAYCTADTELSECGSRLRSEAAFQRAHGRWGLQGASPPAPGLPLLVEAPDAPLGTRGGSLLGRPPGWAASQFLSSLSRIASGTV